MRPIASLACLVSFGLVIALPGCGSTALDDDGSGANAAGSSSSSGSASAGSNSSGGGAMGGGTAGSTATSGDLPCDVQALLATKCLACHGVAPPGKLLSAADFARASTSEPGKTVGAVAVERLQAQGATRMPPSPLEAATAAEIAALSSWVSDGAKPTPCGSAPVPTTPSPYDTPVVCTSMKNWTGGNRESPLMRPGGACISCHTSEGEGPRFAIAGTVFPTAHEPNDCNGVNAASGAQVVITDANGASHTLNVNDAGNFFLETRAFAYPYQAKVVYQGRERIMAKPQDSGDCNSCHTEAGTKDAPGRIFLP